MKKVILVMTMAMVSLASCKVVENCDCREVVNIVRILTSEFDSKLVVQKEVEVFNICTGEISAELTDNPIVKRGDIICN